MRKGMATGQGKGYRNIVGRDSGVHRDSAQGIKQPQKINTFTNIPKHTEALKDYDEYLKKVKDKRENKSLTKTDIVKIERQTRKLMKMDNLSDFELEHMVDKKSLDILYYYILEDANYHSLNAKLEKIGAFNKPYGEDNEIFEQYQNKGGKTWNV